MKLQRCRKQNQPVRRAAFSSGAFAAAARVDCSSIDEHSRPTSRLHIPLSRSTTGESLRSSEGDGSALSSSATSSLPSEVSINPVNGDLTREDAAKRIRFAPLPEARRNHQRSYTTGRNIWLDPNNLHLSFRPDSAENLDESNAGWEAVDMSAYKQEFADASADLESNDNVSSSPKASKMLAKATRALWTPFRRRKSLGDNDDDDNNDNTAKGLSTSLSAPGVASRGLSRSLPVSPIGSIRRTTRNDTSASLSTSHSSILSAADASRRNSRIQDDDDWEAAPPSRSGSYKSLTELSLSVEDEGQAAIRWVRKVQDERAAAIARLRAEAAEEQNMEARPVEEEDVGTSKPESSSQAGLLKVEGFLIPGCT